MEKTKKNVEPPPLYIFNDHSLIP